MKLQKITKLFAQKIIFLILTFSFFNNVWAIKEFLIVANGEWDEAIVRKYMPRRKVIALDGAAINFYKSSLLPDYILGDLDPLKEGKESIGKDFLHVEEVLQHFSQLPTPNDREVKFEKHTVYETLEGAPQIELTYVRAYSQNHTDLDKGVQFCLNQREKDEAVNIIIAGALGGERIDHFFNNFTILKKYKIPNVNIKMLNKLQIVEFLKDEQIEVKGHIEDKLGLFGFSNACASSSGLKWELKNYSLEVGKKSSACNELKSESVNLTIQGEALLMRPNRDP